MLDLDQIIEQAPPSTGKIVHLMESLQAAGEPIILSINGKGNFSISEDRTFQMLFTLVEHLEVQEMLRERLAELDAGGPTFSMEEVKEMLRARHGISV